MSRDDGDFGDRRALRATPLCLRPSATDPTPHRALLKTKAKVQFERPVKRLSKPFFYVFQQSNPTQFQPSFRALTVRSAEGRKLPKNTKRNGFPLRKICCYSNRHVLHSVPLS